ncbi:MAG: putative porin [Pseudomonadales bacterium]|nr:putative porin [Halioglobus sp.]MCP5131908.1 putative porin [Pseudomonadales bacterium]
MKKLLAVAVSGTMLASASVSAAVSDAEFAELKAQFASMAKRLSALEAENNQLRELSNNSVNQLEVAREDLAGARQDLDVVKKQNSETSWAETISLKGDFRYRYEEIDVDGENSRDRSRIRARPSITAELPDNVTVGFGLATGSDDPVSSNQTLGAGNSSKDINLDLAYASWRPIQNTYIEAGKFKNPLFTPQKTAMLWDGDWRPEGFNAGWNGEHVFTTALVNWLESDSKSRNDEVAWGIQTGLKFDIAGASLVTAVGYYDIPVKGNESYYDDSFFGNSYVVDGGVDVYEYDYELFEVSAQLGLSVLDMPLSIFGDFVQNQDPDDYNTGWLAGVQLGNLSGKGSWEVAYQYEDLEADGAFGLVTDSDFAGGGTDGRGSRISGAYGINKQWNLAFTWFINNEAGEKAFKNEGGALEYNRFMLDTNFKY